MEKKEKLTIKNSDFTIAEIDESPFAVLSNKKNNEVWLILGIEKIKKYKTVQLARIAASQYDWDLLGPVIMTIARHAALDVYTDYETKKEKLQQPKK